MDKEQNMQKKLDQLQEKDMEKEWLENEEIEEEMQEENDINKQIIKVKINRYPNTISGVYLYENEEFVVMLNNPVDYVIDGIYFINKNYIKNNIEIDQDIISNKILLHKASLYNTDNMNFSNFKKYSSIY